MDETSRSLREKGFRQLPDGTWYKPDKSERQTPHPLPTMNVCAGIIVQPTKDVNGLNKLEAAWYEILGRRGLVWLGVQNVTLKLADRCRYTPDFAAVTKEGRFLFYETKGFMRPDAEIKLKTAARAFPWATFFLVRKVKGQWDEKEINT